MRKGFLYFCGPWWTLGWSRRQESNLYLALRRHSFYPLNYGEISGAHSKRWKMGAQGLAGWSVPHFQVQMMSRALSVPDWARRV
jgi:hypothetical protein